MIEDQSAGARFFSILNYCALIFLTALMVVPLLHVLSSSFSPSAEVTRGNLILIPQSISLDAYKYIFSTSTITRSMGVSLIITFIGTFLSVLFSSLTAYPLSRRYLQHRSQISAMIVFTMIFSGGMIPSFLVVRSLGLYNTIWALIIPGCISAYNMIIMKNFFSRIPDEMEEAARIDGAGNMRILFQIYLPLSTAILATIALFYAVGYWNNYFNAIMYIKNPRLQPIQVILRQIVILSQGGLGDSSVLDAEIVLPPPTVKMAVIVFATAPILAIYPFLQKYFTKGALLGSVKS